MPRTLYDEAGAPIEVPDEAEITALKAAQEEATKLKEEIKTISDKSPQGIKALREALGRKEEQIAKLQADLGAKPPASLSADDVAKTATTAAQKVLIDAEIARATAGMKDEDRTAFKAKFEKLTAGEAVTLETVSIYVDEASRAAGINLPQKPPPPRTGRGPHIEEEKKDYADSEEGKAFAKRLGLRIEKPEVKK